MSLCSLYLKECKQILKSIIYIIFIGVVLLFYVSQYAAEIPPEESQLRKPQEGEESYGYKSAEIPEQVMPNVLHTLIKEYKLNSYTAYPVGFYKNVKLSALENEKVVEIICAITGLSVEEVIQIVDDYETASMKGMGNGAYYYEDTLSNPIDVPIVVSYDDFKIYMEKLDQMIGGGSAYEVASLSDYGREQITYEEKLAMYNAFIYEDRITGAYARLFCDYMGIVIALFAVFVPVSYFMQDRKAHIQELVYVRSISSVKLIFIRYLAIVTMILIPFVLLSIIPMVQLVSIGESIGVVVDKFAFLKYIVSWLLPSILVTVAVGTFFTVLTDTPIGLVVQFAISFFDVFANASTIGGGEYGYSLALRHNTVGNYEGYKEGVSQILSNRILYSVIAIVLLVATMVIFELKRRGRINLGEVWKNLFGNSRGTNKVIRKK